MAGDFMTAGEDYEAIDSCIRQLIDKYNRLKDEHYRDQELLQLTSADLRAMHVIGISRRERMTNLAKHLRLTVGTLTTTIDRLVAKGYVHRHRREDDRRVVEVSLSQQGREVFEEMENRKRLLAERLFGKLTQEERRILKELLLKLVR